MLGGTLGTPDDTGGGTGSVETGVRTVAFVSSAELPMGFGVKL